MKSRWTRWALRLGALMALAAIGGLFVAAAGLVPIRASAGHWSVTEWFLQFTKRRSIATHTVGMGLPSLDAPWQIAKGAGHYESGCRPCHGSPGRAAPRIAAAMLPPPPTLGPVIARLDPEELFYVVKHGLKFTGMPAWPAQQRDDEVHAMVAFLRVLPSLDEQSYRRLAYGDERPPAASESLRDLAKAARHELIASCDRCHGRDGRGRETAAAPRLAGQKREYLLRALAAYRDDRRHSGIMGPVAAELTVQDQQELADHYSGVADPPLGAALDASGDPALRSGHRIAHLGVPKRGVPPCADCHGPAAHPRNPSYPHLAGQYAEYLLLQLELFEQRHRGGSPYAHLMEHVAARLTREQMRDVAAYYEALVPRAER